MMRKLGLDQYIADGTGLDLDDFDGCDEESILPILLDFVSNPADARRLAKAIAGGGAPAPGASGPSWDIFVPPAFLTTALPVLVQGGVDPAAMATMSQDEIVQTLTGPAYGLNKVAAASTAKKLLATLGKK